MKDADFNLPDSLPLPPRIPTNLTPQDIVGPFAGVLKRHIGVALKATSDNMEKLLSDKFKQDECDIITGLYKELRENGYYIKGLDSAGRIVIGVVLDKDWELMKDLDPIPKKLTADMIRDFRKDLEILFEKRRMPKVTQHDVEIERELTRGM